MQTAQRNWQIAIAIGYCLLIFVAWKFIPHPAVGAAMALAPLAIVGILHAPFLMVLLFVIFSFFRIHEAFPVLMPLRIPLMLALSALFVLGWHIVITQKIQPFWRPEMKWFAAFFAWVSIGVILAVQPAIAIESFTSAYSKIGLMTLAIAWMTREKLHFSVAAKMIAIAGIVIASVALYNKANGIGLVEGTRVTIGRDIRSILGDPNDLALVLMFPMAFAVGLLVVKKSGALSTLIGAIATPMLFSAVIATQSRGGLLGILTIFALFGYRRIKSKAVFISIGVIAIPILLALAGISGRESGGAHEEGIDASAMGRLHAWEAAWGMGVANPLMGVGLANFYNNYFYYTPVWDGKNHAVHSTWFGVLAETGFVGLGLFIGFVTSLILSVKRSLDRILQAVKIEPALNVAAESALAGLAAILVSGTFLTQGFTWPIYILSALVIAIAHWVSCNLEEPKVPETTLDERPSRPVRRRLTHFGDR